MPKLNAFLTVECKLVSDKKMFPKKKQKALRYFDRLEKIDCKKDLREDQKNNLKY